MSITSEAPEYMGAQDDQDGHIGHHIVLHERVDQLVNVVNDHETDLDEVVSLAETMTLKLAEQEVRLEGLHTAINLAGGLGGDIKVAVDIPFADVLDGDAFGDALTTDADLGDFSIFFDETSPRVMDDFPDESECPDCGPSGGIGGIEDPAIQGRIVDNGIEDPGIQGRIVAYEEGFVDGQEDALDESYDEGHEDGYFLGYEDGYQCAAHEVSQPTS